MRCRLSPAADVPSHTSGAAVGITRCKQRHKQRACGRDQTFRRSSAVATKREGQRTPLSDRAGQHQRLDRGQAAHSNH